MHSILNSISHPYFCFKEYSKWIKNSIFAVKNKKQKFSKFHLKESFGWSIDV